MNGAVFGGIIRAALAAAGGWLVSKGFATEEGAASMVNSASDLLTGLGSVAIAVAWSWWTKRNAAKK